MKRPFSIGTRIRDVVGKVGVVVGCVDEQVLWVPDEPFRFHDGQRMTDNTMRDCCYHEDLSADLGEYEAVSEDTFAEGLRTGRGALNEHIRTVAPDTGKTREIS